MRKTVFGRHEAQTLAQLDDVLAHGAEQVALMADGHLGFGFPIGGVAAYVNKVSLNGVGYDIGCGNCAVRLDRQRASLSDQELTNLADEIAATISFGLGRTNRADDAPTAAPIFADDRWALIPRQHRQGLRERARAQLGTVGGGNHYVDIFADEAGDIWVGVHFGSRGFGHTVASNFFALGQGLPWGARAREAQIVLDLNSEIGRNYWQLMGLALDYAYLGREWVTRKVADLLGAEIVEMVHNHHNAAFEERQPQLHADAGEPVIVVRKGATPAFPGQRGFVGGSMGDNAVILQGSVARDPEVASQQAATLYSTVHGAGRVMSRGAAKGSRPKLNKPTGEWISKRKGQVTRQMMSAWTKERGIIVRGGDVDEAPQVYRRLPDVLAAQGPTIEVLHSLTPLIVVMAGADVRDPYKD